MTTKFNSFDTSPLSGFVQSPLGARNRTRPRSEFFVFVVWGSEKAYGPPTPPGSYDVDVENWTEQSNLRPVDSFAAGFFREGFILDWPFIPNVTNLVLGVGPTLEVMLQSVLDLIPDQTIPTEFHLVHNVVLQFPQDVFRELDRLLRERFGPRLRVVEKHFFSERRWLLLLTNELVREMPLP